MHGVTDSKKNTAPGEGTLLVVVQQIIKDQRADVKQIQKLIKQVRLIEEALLILAVRMDAVQDKVDYLHP